MQCVENSLGIPMYRHSKPGCRRDMVWSVCHICLDFLSLLHKTEPASMGLVVADDVTTHQRIVRYVTSILKWGISFIYNEGYTYTICVFDMKIEYISYAGNARRIVLKDMNLKIKKIGGAGF